MTAPISIKCVVIGDGAVGKTCLLTTFTTNTFPTEYYPTVFDNYTVETTVDEKVVMLWLWDTAGQEDYDRIRPISYQGANVFLACFSVNNRQSFSNLKTKWIPEIRHVNPKAAILIVGCKSDKRDAANDVPKGILDNNSIFVSVKEAEKLVEEMDAIMYVECSALRKLNIEEVFNEAVRAAMNPQKRKSILPDRSTVTASHAIERKRRLRFCCC